MSNRKSFAALCAAWMSLVGFVCGGENENITGIDLPVGELAPKVDGNLDDPAWARAQSITNFVIITTNDYPIAEGITAKIMRNEEWLFVGFDIRHPNPGHIQPKVTRRDDKVQWEDCVKIAFDPGTDGKLWYHLRLSAGNVQSDQRNTGTGAELSWDMPWRSASRRTEKGWQAELALPLAFMLDRGNPQKARLNLLVYSYIPVVDPYGVEINQRREVAGLIPTPADWWNHAVKFAPVTGLDAETVRAAFLPVLEQPKLSEYQKDADGKYSYLVEVALVNPGSRAGRARVAAIDRPAGGPTNLVVGELDLPANGRGSLTLQVPAANLNSRELTVELRTLQDEVINVRTMSADALNVFAGYLDRNYYTAETAAYAVCRISLPAVTLRDLRLEAYDPSGQKLNVADDLAPEMRMPVQVNSLPDGTHAITLKLLNKADNQTVAGLELSLIKRPAAPGREWKISRENAAVLHDGRPFFAYGLLVPPSSFNDTELADIKAAGFNSILLWGKDIYPHRILELLDMAERHGLYMGVRFETPYTFKDIPLSDNWLKRMGMSRPHLEMFGSLTSIKGRLCGMSQVGRLERNNLFNEAYQAVRPAISNAIMSLREHPALMFWEGFDEPQPAHFDQFEQGLDLYRLVYALDGSHPVRVLWNSGLPPWEGKYTAWSDFHARDPYWFPPDRGPDWVAEQVLQLAERGAADHKPVSITPVLERWSGNHKRCQSPAEQRAQTYLAVIHGASWLFYFLHPCVNDGMWSVMREMGAELKILGPIMLAGRVPSKVAHESESKMPDAHVAVGRRPEGDYVLISANSRPFPVAVRFLIPELDAGRPVHALFSTHSFPAQADGFEDLLEPYGTRCYLFHLKSEPDAEKPLTVTVQTTARKENYKPETVVPRSGYEERKNILPNPGFEEATIPGWPDYWFNCGWQWYLVGTNPAASAAFAPDERVGCSNAVYELDENNPFEGKYSLRMAPGWLINRWAAPQHKQPTKYVLSLFMRSDADGLRARVSGVGMAHKDFALAREWKRYHLPVVMPANASPYSAIYIGVKADDPNRQGHVWVDAMQLELGEEPTEYDQ